MREAVRYVAIALFSFDTQEQHSWAMLVKAARAA
jgi:hypothetical protein